MRANIAGYILAGGKGTRMGGMDKLSLKYQGRYLALWTIEALSMLDTWYVSVAEIPKDRWERQDGSGMFMRISAQWAAF